MWSTVLNTAWLLQCATEYRAFERACRNVAASQAAVLRDILHANHDTLLGRTYGFRDIATPRSYQQRVPPTSYDDLAPLIGRIAEGEKNVLTRETVRLLEPTSGTTSGEKLIPYTRGLQRQFQRGVAAWIANLFLNRPALRRGRAYWSISPALGPPRRSAGGIPIGFEDDASYLGGFEQWLLRNLLVVPGPAARIAESEAFRYTTLRCLLAAEDLSLISVWHPTFLTSLLSKLPVWIERLVDDIVRGAVTPPTPLPGDVAARLKAWARPDPRRGRALHKIWQDNGSSVAEKLRRTWWRLALISCWADAGAALAVPKLRELFPGVELQPKGLLATEGFVSFPLIGHPGAALAVRSHFFEFEDIGTGRFLLARELELCGQYRVLLTTAGGLYRYQLRDQVEVAGFHCQCPLLRFVGKADLVCDLVGEKLAEVHVRSVLARFAPGFALLVPALDGKPRYRLYLQGTQRDDQKLRAQRDALETGLAENPYYRHAVALGQLAPAEVTLLDPTAEPAWLVYERGCRERGQKSGDIKPVALDRGLDWPARFAPLVIATVGHEDGNTAANSPCTVTPADQPPSPTRKSAQT